MKFKAIIFDFDGVLFDSEKIHLQACNEVFHTLGFNIPEEEYFQHYVGLSDNEMFPLILNDKNIKCDSSQLKALRANKINAYKTIINRSKSLDGLLNVKSFISSYVHKVDYFAICSGATREEIEITLNKLENGTLRKYFKTIITIDDVSLGKPSPEGYLLAASRLGLQPEHCLAIEDTSKGASAAKDAGMCVAAINPFLSKADFKNVDLIAKNYGEIDTWLKGLNNLLQLKGKIHWEGDLEASREGGK